MGDYISFNIPGSLADRIVEGVVTGTYLALLWCLWKGAQGGGRLVCWLASLTRDRWRAWRAARQSSPLGKAVLAALAREPIAVTPGEAAAGLVIVQERVWVNNENATAELTERDRARIHALVTRLRRKHTPLPPDPARRERLTLALAQGAQSAGGLTFTTGLYVAGQGGVSTII